MAVHDTARLAAWDVTRQKFVHGRDLQRGSGDGESRLSRGYLGIFWGDRAMGSCVEVVRCGRRKLI